MTKVISVIIPVYNSALWIDECIYSVLSQNHEDYEVLVCDDFSLDNSFRRLSDYHNSISLISNHRTRGICASLNSCLRMAKGEWVAFLRPDDRYHPSFLKRQLKFAENNSYDFVYSNYIDFEISKEGTEQKQKYCEFNPITAEEIIDGDRGRGFPIISSVLIRKKFLIDAGFFDEGFGGANGIMADSIMWTKVLKLGARFGFNKENFGTFALRYPSIKKGFDGDSSEFLDLYKDYLKKEEIVKSDYCSLIKREEENRQLQRVVHGHTSQKNIVWIGCIDPGGISAMYKKAFDKYSDHNMRIITHNDSRGFDSDIVLQKHLWAGDNTYKDMDNIKHILKDSDIFIFSAAVSVGSSRFDVRGNDTDEVEINDIDVRPYIRDKSCVAFFYGSTSIRRHYKWYYDYYNKKGWGMLTCQPDIYHHLPGSTSVSYTHLRAHET